MFGIKGSPLERGVMSIIVAGIGGVKYKERLPPENHLWSGLRHGIILY
jgi:hypothetical protein